MKNFDYDLVVIGGGRAGFASSKSANGLGKKVAIIEKRKLGGNITFACVPSKALLKVSRVAHKLAHLEAFGLKSDHPVVLNTDQVMAHVRSVVQAVCQDHLPDNFEKLGIRVLFGEPQFMDRHHLKLGDDIISSKNFMIATGSSPLIPPIEGIDEVPCLTNETIFNLNTLPPSMIVLGGGPIGVELGAALNRLGVKVTLIETAKRILVKEDEELVQILTQRLQEEGIKILTNAKVIKFINAQGRTMLTIEDEANQTNWIEADNILIATGRKANTDGLSLEKAGVKVGPNNVMTGDHLMTTAQNIYASGDVAGPYLYKHMAEHQANLATLNAFLPVRKRVNYKNVAWCTFTDPELAHAGLTEEEAREHYGDKIRVYRHQYSKIDRAKTEMAETGLSKLICDRKGNLVGAHILGNRAGEIINEAQLVKSLNLPLAKIQSAIHVYPSYSDAVSQPAGLSYIDTPQNNFMIKWLKKVLPGI